MTKINSFESLKTRYWCFLAYKESLPKDFQDFLIMTGAKGCISPLHDEDIITTNDFKGSHHDYYVEHGQKIGDLKKPHYHIIICSNGPTTQNYIDKRVCKPLKATKPFPLISVTGMWHYLFHDQELYPDKHPYSKSRLKGFNGFDISDYVDMSSKQSFEVRKHIIDFINLNSVYNYRQLERGLKACGLTDEYYVLDHNHTYFKDYLAACRYDNDKMSLKYKLQDYNTGEIKELIFTPEQLGINA